MPSNNEVSPLEALGGQQVLDQLVDRFYTYIKEHDDVRHLFPDDLTQTAYKQKNFLTQFLADRRCIQKNLVPSIKARHLPFTITTVQAEAWLSCMERAMDDVHLSGDIRDYMMHRLTLTAHHMVNHTTSR
ncbi:LOW QUALITY PROTEIN: hemoglobin-like protein HbO [Bacillus sp. JCM 19046]|nr:LOW QUALITY PROTEIN: hemoglobin-like protein HbO [Bacillus sp. JCM 19046]